MKQPTDLIPQRTLPWHVDEHPLPPHDLRLYSNDGTTLARVDGQALDETGRRAFDTETFESIARLIEAVHGLVTVHEALPPVRGDTPLGRHLDSVCQAFARLTDGQPTK